MVKKPYTCSASGNPVNEAELESVQTPTGVDISDHTYYKFPSVDNVPYANIPETAVDTDYTLQSAVENAISWTRSFEEALTTEILEGLEPDDSIVTDSYLDTRWRGLSEGARRMRDDLESMHQSRNQIVFKLRTGLELVEALNLALTQMGPLGKEIPNIQQQLIWYKKYRHNLNNAHRAIKSVLQTAERYLENLLRNGRDNETIRRYCDSLSNDWIRLLSRVSIWNTQLGIKAGGEKQLKLLQPEPQYTQPSDQRFKTWREQLDFTVECVDRLNREARNIPELSPSSRKLVTDLNVLVQQLKHDVERELVQGHKYGHDSVSFAGGWKSAEIDGIFYYIDTNTGSTQWDHPAMASILSQLSQFNDVRFAAYRTALKLRSVQKELKLHLVRLESLTTLLNPLKLGDASCNRLLTAPEMAAVLASIYNLETETNLLTHLALNYFTNCFNNARRRGIRNLSFQVGLVLLCSGTLEAKFKYLISLITEGCEKLNSNQLKVLLKECSTLPKYFGEHAFFGNSNIELSVQSCFERQNKPLSTLTGSDFLAWVNLGPQLLVWLHVLQRVVAGEDVIHTQRCDACKLVPIRGLRFRCLRCFNLNLCQRCFLDGKRLRSHRLTHPVHEYYWQSTSCENTRDFIRVFKNRFKSKRRLKGEICSSYLPTSVDVDTALPDIREDEEQQFPHPPQPIQIPQSSTNANITVPSATKQPKPDEEHRLIAKYCQSLKNSSPSESQSRSQSQHELELDSLLRSVEEENVALEREYEHLCSTTDPELSRNVLNEARQLRQHKRRLRRRMTVLQLHKAELEEQLRKLQELNTTAS